MNELFSEWVRRAVETLSEMLRNPDQAPVVGKAFIVSVFPEFLQGVVGAFISIAALISVFGGLFALLTLMERKGLGRIQNRPGPNRVGPFGILQPVADGLKMLTKEDIVPFRADAFLHFIAPVILVMMSLLTLAVIPYGRNMAPIELDSALLFFFAAGACTELAVFLAGWASRNKYSLLGAMRAIAQMISYELPLLLASFSAVLLVGSLSLVSIVDSQGGFMLGVLPKWNVLTPWGFVGFIIFMIGAFAESNRSPFDLPEAESELIAGHLTEYSGFKYALFFMAEYIGMLAISGLAVTLFLGGWHAPVPFLGWVPSYCWFFAKLLTLACFFIWVRATLPRLRADQLMALAWKCLIPLSFINLGVTVFWHYSAAWSFAMALPARWGIAFLALAVPYTFLARQLGTKKTFARRTYRFAE